MDAAHILVAVLITVAAGWLVWVELHCRRDTRRTIVSTAEEGQSHPGIPETDSERRP